MFDVVAAAMLSGDVAVVKNGRGGGMGKDFLLKPMTTVELGREKRSFLHWAWPLLLIKATFFLSLLLPF